MNIAYSLNKASISYFNSFNELFSSKSSEKEKGVALLKILSLATAIIPLAFAVAYGISCAMLKGRVKIKKKDDSPIPPHLKPVGPLDKDHQKSCNAIVQMKKGAHENGEDKLEEKLSGIYSGIVELVNKTEEPQKPFFTESYGGTPIYFGLSKQGLYIETTTKSNNPVHIEIYADGKGVIIPIWCQDYGFSMNISRPLNQQDMPLIEWALPIIRKKLHKMTAPVTHVHSPYAATQKGTTAESAFPEKVVFQTLFKQIDKVLSTEAIADRAGLVRVYSYSGTPIEFGKFSKGLFLQTLTKKNAPIHIQIFPDGSGWVLDRWWSIDSSTFPADTFARPLVGEDVNLIKWALPVMKNAVKPKTYATEIPLQQKNPSEVKDFYDGKRILGTKIPGKVQEKDSGGYDWKEKYFNSPLLGDYAKAASNAVIAYRGSFSNNQRERFYDPISNIKFHSAEQMFHFYKFPSKDPRRHLIINSPNPDAARKTAKSLTIDLYDKMTPEGISLGTMWGEMNKELMVYIQLAKALEPLTTLYEALVMSGNDFIIEDTSLRKEKFWGDAGDGSGENKLGWAQMEARSFFNKGQGILNEAMVSYYFNTCVFPKLDAYYKAFAYVSA